MFEPFYHFNSRASHHVIVDLVNMPLSQPYKGNDQLVVSNGKDIFISSIFLPFLLVIVVKNNYFWRKSYMFLQLIRIFWVLHNLAKEIMFILSFILILVLWRTRKLTRSFSRVHFLMAFMFSNLTWRVVLLLFLLFVILHKCL